MHILQCDYFNRRHLDWVDQSDYRKVTIYSEKSRIITTKQNKLNGSKSTNDNVQTWPFEPAKESKCFPRGPLDRVTEAKNFSDSYIFDLRWHVIANRGNSSERNSWYNVHDKITACVKEICLMGVYAKFWVYAKRLVKHLLSWKTLAINIAFFLELLMIGWELTFLECILIFLLSDWSTLSRWPLS